MTSNLSRDSLLERAPSISLELHSAGNASARVEGRTVSLGIHALSILAACTEPKRVGDLAAQAQVAGGRDFADFMAAVLDLLRTGLLLARGAGTNVVPDRGSWNDPGIHVSMLNDATRTQAFVTALRQTVKPTDIVLDIGTGTGILAVTAALAGAKRVFAIEATSMAGYAEALAELNGVADKVTVLRGWSSRLTLEERATVLVTETIGNDPLSEHMVEIMRDAIARLLVPGATIIPRLMRLFVTLVECPPDLLDRLAYTQSNVAKWSSSFGINFLSMLDLRPDNAFPSSIIPKDAAELIPLSEPVEVATLDLRAPVRVADRILKAVVTRPGKLHGALLSFEVELTDGITVTTEPKQAGPDSHWLTTFWVEHRPRPVVKDEVIEISFQKVGSDAIIDIARPEP